MKKNLCLACIVALFSCMSCQKYNLPLSKSADKIASTDIDTSKGSSTKTSRLSPEATYPGFAALSATSNGGYTALYHGLEVSFTHLIYSYSWTEGDIVSTDQPITVLVPGCNGCNEQEIEISADNDIYISDPVVTPQATYIGKVIRTQYANSTFAIIDESAN